MKNAPWCVGLALCVSVLYACRPIDVSIDAERPATCDFETESAARATTRTTFDSWQSAYSAYEAFEACDDGVIAEAFSDLTTRLLAEAWGQLANLEPFWTSDTGFAAFVTRHVDATVPEQRLEDIRRLATDECPGSLDSLCRTIEVRALRALLVQSTTPRIP